MKVLPQDLIRIAGFNCAPWYGVAGVERLREPPVRAENRWGFDDSTPATRPAVLYWNPYKRCSMFRFSSLLPFIVTSLLLTLVVAVGLPWMLHLRELARKTQWRNYYKQVGLAMHNFHDTHNMFPSGGIFLADGTPYQGWMFSIAPFLDASPFYSEVTNFSKPWDDPETLGYYMYSNYPVHDYTCPGKTRLRGPMTICHMAGNSWILHRNSSVNFEKIGDSAHTMLIADAAEPYEVFGSTTNWRDPELARNTGPQSFGNCFPGVTFVLLADGSVIQVTLVENERWKLLRGREELHPDPIVTQRPDTPWELGDRPYVPRDFRERRNRDK